MKVLFLCTGNSCRSQIAEGWCKHLFKDKIECHSAGIKKSHVNPFAIEVMREVGVDLSQHYSKTTEDLGHIEFDVVYTLCGHANETCPVFHGAKIEHVGFSDPDATTRGLNRDETLQEFRKTRDEIFKFIQSLENTL